MASPMREKHANRRIRLLLAVFALVFAAMFARAVWLQGVQAAHLSSLAKSQHEETQTIPAGRGTIFDRTGVQLALGEQMTTVYADPYLVRNARGIALAAHDILGVDPNTLLPELMNKKSRFVYVKRFADPKTAALFLKKGFQGVESYPEELRAYPQGTVGAQVLGYAGIDGHGLGGLELQYDHKLAGRPGNQTIVRDPTGRTIDVISSRPAWQGSDVFTTIDHTIQAQAERVLDQTVKQWGATDATAVVLDPTTGEILALAQTPSYDANRTPEVPAVDLRNRAVTDTYEPGSTYKLVTITGALSDGLVTPRTRFTLPYQFQYGPCWQCTVHDAELRGTVNYSVAQVLAYSSNVGAVTIAEKLGPARLAAWVHRFGFGSVTGIDFPGESPGFVLPLAQWSETTIGNVPIGQGISVTAIQLASVYAAIANGGVWTEPHLVDHVVGREPPPLRHRRILKAGIDHELLAMLKGVVSDQGTAALAAIPGYSVAGKTGTAQKPGPHGYIPGAYVATFVGIVPARAPRLVVLVSVDEPHGQIYGGLVAAPAFEQIASFDLQYLEVPPDLRLPKP